MSDAAPEDQSTNILFCGLFKPLHTLGDPLNNLVNNITGKFSDRLNDRISKCSGGVTDRENTDSQTWISNPTAIALFVLIDPRGAACSADSLWEFLRHTKEFVSPVACKSAVAA